MKQTSKNIQSILNNKTINDGLKNLSLKNPNYETQETSVIQAYEGYLDIQSTILESIDKGIFEELPFNSRNSILSHLQQIQRYYNNAAQFVAQYNALLYQFQITNLSSRIIEDFDFETESKAITSLRRKYKKIITDLENSEEIKSEINKIKNDTEKLLSRIEEIAKESNDFSQEINTAKSNIEITANSIQESEQEIENRKKEILAFASNVDKSEKTISKIESDLKSEIEKSITLNINKSKELIKQAEEALELKQTEGISKAYSSRLSKLTSEKTKNRWLIGAIVFLVLTFITGFLLTGGKINLWGFTVGFNDTENLAFVLGRILLTGIGISGSIFCANRYVYIKNLEEDYEYKVVLSKSILAFSNKIKELDDKKVAEYLTTVLNDLHQDPLRDRKSKNKKNNIDIESLNQISELISKWKEIN